MKINDIMHSKVVMLSPEDTVKRALDVMNKNKINGTPVVDKDKNLLGIIVKADVYRFLIQEGHYDTYPVSSIMTKKVVTADISEDIVEVAKKLVDNHIVAIPILKEDKVVGMVSMEVMLEYFVKYNRK